MVRLREVTVTASERQSAYRSYAEFSDSQYSGKLLEQLKQSVGSGSAFDLLGRLPRTQIVGYDLNIFGCRLFNNFKTCYTLNINSSAVCGCY